MRTSTNGIAPGTDIVWENSRHGTLGWATMVVPSRNPSGNIKALIANDTTGLNIRDVTADPVGMTRALTPTNCAGLGIFDYAGGNPEFFGADWAGQSNVNFWAILPTKVVYFNGSVCLDKTPSGGITTRPGSGQNYRQIPQRCASDPVQGGVFVACFAAAGWKKTLDGGTTWSGVTGVPAPLGPDKDGNTASRVGLVSCDTTSARTGTAPADRYSRWALTSHGNGIYISTDGLATGSKISPTSPHALDGCTALLWDGGTLYAVAGDLANWGNNPANNLWRWSGSGTTWTQLSNVQNMSWVGIIRDPRTAGAFILTTPSAAFCYCADLNTPAAYKYFNGNNAVTPFQQIKIKGRPLVATTYRNGGGGFAPGPMAVVGPYLYYMMGYGPIRTPIATFPTAGAEFTPVYSPLWPDWEEDGGGYEAIVGQFPVWTAKELVCGGQDIGFAVFHNAATGHDASYQEFPGTTLTNGVGGSSGVLDRNFACFGSFKNGPIFGYTNDGARSFTRMANAPTNYNTPNAGGGVVAGPNKAAGVCLSFPSLGGVPEYTDDLGVTAWKPLLFYTSASGTTGQLNVSGYADNGFHGGPYYANHWPCVADPNNPGVYYAVNLGGSTTAGNDTWEADPLGYAGLYKMDWAAEPGVFRRVMTGRLISWGNQGFYGLYTSITNDGHLLISPNSLANGPNAGNYSVDVDLTAKTSRNITQVQDLTSLWAGPPMVTGGPSGSWALGWYGSTFGLWLSFDRFLTAPTGPGGTPFNFNFAIPNGGYLKNVIPHPSKFGLLGAGLDQGHARGILQMT